MVLEVIRTYNQLVILRLVVVNIFTYMLFIFIRCGTKIGQNSVAMIVLTIIFFTLITIIFCYAHVMKTIRNVKEINKSITNSRNNLLQLTNVERKTFKKVLTYILVFILQYVPIMIYDVTMFLRVRKKKLYFL
jgi:predicted PurR-regulated permease PerM